MNQEAIAGFFASLLNWVLATFLIGPLQAEMNSHLQDAQAPAAIVRQVQDCVRTATPVLMERASHDLWWGMTTAISVSTGLTNPETILSRATPSCAAAISAVRPFLDLPRV